MLLTEAKQPKTHTSPLDQPTIRRFKICIESRKARKPWWLCQNVSKMKRFTTNPKLLCIHLNVMGLPRRYESKCTFFFFFSCVSLSSETGSAITSSCIGLGNSLTPPAGQAGKPVPGYNGKRQSCRATSQLQNTQNTNRPLLSVNFLCRYFYIFKFNFTFRSLFQCSQ